MNSLRTLLLTAVPAAAVLLAACNDDCIEGNGVAATEKRDLDAFSQIDVGGSYKLVLRQDPVQSLTISADENTLPYIRTEVSGGRLRIFSDKNICDRVEVAIGIKELTRIDASGAVDIEMLNRFVTNEFDLDVSGAVEARLDLEAKNIHTELSGAGEILYRGNAESHRVTISGAGKLNADELLVNNYDIDVSGAADCSVHVLKELHVDATGASSIVYKGNPEVVDQQVSGAGSVRPAK